MAKKRPNRRLQGEEAEGNAWPKDPPTEAQIKMLLDLVVQVLVTKHWHWAQPFESAEPEVPLTQEEKIAARDLLFTMTDDLTIAQFKELAKSPTRLRQFMTEMKEFLKGSTKDDG